MIHARAATSVLILMVYLSPASAQLGNEHTPDERSKAYGQQSIMGHYRISIGPVDGDPPIAAIHDWVIHLESADGSLFTPRQLVISGGMPGHGHGFATEPQITRYLENGDYLVEGMKFHMPGTWELIVGVTGPKGPDSATFEIRIGAAEGEQASHVQGWTVAEIQLMKSLSIDQLTDSPVDASNRFSGNSSAARLGELLFQDRGLSGSKRVACADCHKPERLFADDKRYSVGTTATSRNAPGLLGVSHHKWFYWDGRRDSLWSQAVTPMETRGEMDNNRMDVARYVLEHEDYAVRFRELGGMAPDFSNADRFPAGAGPFSTDSGKQKWLAMQASDREAVNKAFSDIGKVIAVYLEELQPEASRFDRFVSGLARDDAGSAESVLTDEEQAGLRLFLDIGRTTCLRCHNGPLFTNFGFHNIATGVTDSGFPDFGRMLGLQAAMVDEFNCRGKYSDARPDECKEMRFATSEESAHGAFKVPGLRGVAETAPYMHDGRFARLEEAVRFYTLKPDPETAPSEVSPVELTDLEVSQIVAFLGSLSGSP